MDLTLELELGDGDGGASRGLAPTDIAWAGSHTVAEDAALGTVVGGALSAVDPEAGVVTFTIPDATSLFAVSGTSVIVAGVLDYETLTSHNVTIRATDDKGNTYDEVFAITVSDVAEGAPEDPPPDDDPIVDDEDNFDILPHTIDVSGSVKFAGKKKNNGLSAKFMHDFSAEIGPLVAGQEYIFSFTADFSLMQDEGAQTSVGLMLKTGNDFYSIGVKGDGGASGLDAYTVSDGANKWNETTGFTITNEGDVAHGTQWADIWIKIIVSEDGTALTLQTGTDIDTWSDDVVEASMGPFDDVGDITQWGIGGIFDSEDAGPYSIEVTYWEIVPVGEVDSLWGNVVFLTNADGVDESTAPLPDLTGNHLMTITGTTKLDSTHVKYGTTALYAANSVTTVSVPSSTDFNFGSGPFCIEYSFYQSDRTNFSNYDAVQRFDSGQWMMLIRHNGNGWISFYYSLTGGDLVELQFANAVGTANAWHDYCFERDASNNLRCWRDGVFIAKQTFNITFHTSTSTFKLCHAPASQMAWMDEIRVTKGAFRYGSDANYTPRTSPFPYPNGGLLDGIVGVTGAWSMSRALFEVYDGAFYTTATGVNSWIDQTGGLKPLLQSTAANQPAVTTAGPNSRACANLDGTNDSLRSSGAAGQQLGSFIVAATGWMVISCIADVIDANNATVYSNEALLGDSGGFFGLFTKTGDAVHAYSYDGTVDSVSATVVEGTPYVIEWRHEGGVLYCRINNGTEVSVASGNITGLTSPLCVGSTAVSPTGPTEFDGKIFELVTFNTIPTLAQREAIVADMMAWIGAVAMTRQFMTSGGLIDSSAEREWMSSSQMINEV